MMNSFNPVKAAISVTVSLLSCGSILSLGTEAKAQYYPECFMTNEFGEVLDLSSICGYSNPQTESRDSIEEASQDSTEEVGQDSEESSSTYVGRRQPEISPTEGGTRRRGGEELYRGYQDLLRGSTLENRRSFREAASETGAESGSRSRSRSRFRSR